MEDHSDTPGRPDTPLKRAVSLILPPLCVVAMGLLLTAFAARIAGPQALEQSALLFQARHTALVNAVTDYPDLTPDSQRFASLIYQRVPEGLSVRIDTLETHTKTPAFEVSSGHARQNDHTLRSEVNLAGQRWLISTTPDRVLFRQGATAIIMQVWTTGLAVALMGAFICTLVTLRWRRQLGKTAAIRRDQQAQARELTSALAEKRILRQALDDSEQRSRDLVLLSGGIVCEIDEQGKAGYVSGQAAEVLGVAPADLEGVAVESLIAEPDRHAFRQALGAARQDRHMQRVDLHLTSANQQPLPASLRVLALHDTLHGFCGFRLTLQLRR